MSSGESGGETPEIRHKIIKCKPCPPLCTVSTPLVRILQQCTKGRGKSLYSMYNRSSYISFSWENDWCSDIILTFHVPAPICTLSAHYLPCSMNNDSIMCNVRFDTRYSDKLIGILQHSTKGSGNSIYSTTGTATYYISYSPRKWLLFRFNIDVSRSHFDLYCVSRLSAL